jgi:hypothetical protein
MWNITVSAVEWHQAENHRDWEDFVFKFFNKHAGQTRGAEATGAFCALREGLDTTDTSKFPVAIYGGASGTGQEPERFNERAVRIVASRAARGAKIDDLAGASKGMMFQRKEQTGLNDVGEQVLRGNFERFLTQINPDNTSVGLWRVGGIVTATTWHVRRKPPTGPGHTPAGKSYSRPGLSESQKSGRNVVARY